MFKYLIIIEPLGLLYGSSGRFLSPENLVGRSGTQFPPTTATLSGLFAAHYGDRSPQLENLCLGGPFWAKNDKPQNFYVPTPFNCLVAPVPLSTMVKAGAIEYEIKHQLVWKDNQWQTRSQSEKEEKWEKPPVGKFASETWVSITDWKKLQRKIDNEKPQFFSSPWEFLPHLHPRLQADRRRVATEAKRNQGSLFLENSVQLDPETCLIYLSNEEIPDGWYRFGGEGHLVDLRCKSLSDPGKHWLNQPLKSCFALITPAVWGSNRLSYREPMVKNGDAWEPIWYRNGSRKSFFTRRPHPLRYRLGKRGVISEDAGKQIESSDDSNSQQLEKQPPRPLSRGRYAVLAGTIYVLDRPLETFLKQRSDRDDSWPTWSDWPESWFPTEAYSFKRWGCGLALPLEGAIAHN